MHMDYRNYNNEYKFVHNVCKTLNNCTHESRTENNKINFKHIEFIDFSHSSFVQ